jgi:hypothetical protein
VKQTLLFLMIFAVAFVATILLSRELLSPPSIAGPGGPDVQPADPDAAAAAQRQADIKREMINRGAAAAADEKPVEAGASEDPATGEIIGKVKTDDGRESRNLVVTLFPPIPDAAAVSGNGFRIARVPEGTYHVGIVAEGYLSRTPAEVKVEKGKKYEIELWLESGLELRGTVIEDVDQRPIAGVLIDFNGMGQATTDSSGAFKTGLVPPKALEVITLTHDEYDRNVVVHPVLPDPHAIVLAMSRGKAVVTGRILAAGNEPAPGVFRVRIIRAPMEGSDEVRRERVFRGVTNFEIRGVFPGMNVLEVSFPGTGYTTRRIELELDKQPSAHVEVDLQRGSQIDGAYVTPSGLIAGIPITLVDSKNHVMGETRTDPAGKFRFERASEGEYAIRIDARIPPLYTETFKVEEGKPASITVDGQTGRLKP